MTNKRTTIYGKRGGEDELDRVDERRAVVPRGIKQHPDRINVDLLSSFSRSVSRPIAPLLPQTGKFERAFSPNSKLSSEPLLMIPCNAYTVSGTPNSVLNSASICDLSVKSALMVTALAPSGARGSTMSARMRWQLGVFGSSRSAWAS